MANDYDLPNSLNSFALFPVQYLTASNDGPNIDLANYQGVIAGYLSVGLPSNVSAVPKLNIVIQQATDAITYTDVAGSNVNITNANTSTTLSLDTRSLYRYIRVRANIADGNSPKWPVAFRAVGTLQYNPS